MTEPLSWQPTAPISQLRFRAQTIQTIRQFFLGRDVLEVDTPLLSPATIPDPAIASLRTQCFFSGGSNTLYLQTSPEFYMKRLLAADSGPIFQICKAFRDGEQGRMHNPEFTMLEWYRPGFDHHDLMNEVAELLQTVMKIKSVTKLSYAELFENFLAINPHRATADELAKLTLAQNIHVQGIEQDDKDSWLNLLLTHCIEPQLTDLTFIYDYPASQAALAKIRHDNDPVAERFEAYLDSTELANGFHELADADEQRTRFENDNKTRLEQGLAQVPIDQQLLAALHAGFPHCSGVALGIDRLVMLAAQQQAIADVMSFTTEVE